MCGIFGWSFDKKARVPAGQREVLASTLAVANSMRGDQSWGAYLAGQKKRAPVTRREVGDIADVPGIAALAAYPVVMAHTRYATTGKVAAENQHPFKVGKVLLAHNGMIFNHTELNVKYGRNCTVDSQHFAHHIAKSLPVTDIEAYGSIEWVELDRPESVYLSRLKGGVLSVAGIRNAKGKTIGVVWSSDRAHLDSALGASRLDTFPFKSLAEGEVYEVTRGMLYTTRRPVLAVDSGSMSREEARWARWRTSGARGTYSSLTGSDTRWDSASWDGGCYAGWATEDDAPTTEVREVDEPRVKEYVRINGIRPVDAGMWVDRRGELLSDDDILLMVEAEEEAWRASERLTGSDAPAYGGKE